jgi:hypothetical protein
MALYLFFQHIVQAVEGIAAGAFEARYDHAYYLCMLLVLPFLETGGEERRKRTQS